MNVISFLTEGKVCQTSGPAAQLAEDRPVQVPGMYIIYICWGWHIVFQRPCFVYQDAICHNMDMSSQGKPYMYSIETYHKVKQEKCCTVARHKIFFLNGIFEGFFYESIIIFILRNIPVHPLSQSNKHAKFLKKNTKSHCTGKSGTPSRLFLIFYSCVA